MGLYYQSVDAIALVGTTAKTVAELSPPSTVDGLIKEWWIEFDGVTATAVPVKCEIGRFSAAVTTATTLALAKFTSAQPTAGTVFKHSTSTEGAGTASDVKIHRISPTSGYHYIAPLGQEIPLLPSTFWRIRLTAAVAVNATIGVIIQE